MCVEHLQSPVSVWRLPRTARSFSSMLPAPDASIFKSASVRIRVHVWQVRYLGQWILPPVTAPITCGKRDAMSVSRQPSDTSDHTFYRRWASRRPSWTTIRVRIWYPRWLPSSTARSSTIRRVNKRLRSVMKSVSSTYSNWWKSSSISTDRHHRDLYSVSQPSSHWKETH